MSCNNKEFCTPIIPYKFGEEYKDARGFVYVIPDNFVIGSAPTYGGSLETRNLTTTTNTFSLLFSASAPVDYMNKENKSYNFHIFSY